MSVAPFFEQERLAGRQPPSLRDSACIDCCDVPTLKRGANNHCAYGAGRAAAEADFGAGGIWCSALFVVVEEAEDVVFAEAGAAFEEV